MLTDRITVDIDGSGQVLRNALSFSSILEKEVHLRNFRLTSSPPGFRAAHVGTVHLLKEITNAQTSAYDRGSTSIDFAPQQIQSGNYHVDIEEIKKGSHSLITSSIQAVVPVMMFADSISSFEMRGGTHLPADLPAIYMQEILVPFLERYFDLNVDLDILKHGWRGQGVVNLTIAPLFEPIEAKEWIERGQLHEVSVSIHIANLSAAERAKVEKLRVQIIKDLAYLVTDPKVKIIDLSDHSSPDRVVSIFLHADFDEIPAGFTDMVYLDSEREEDLSLLWSGVLQKFRRHIHSNKALDPYLADMMLVYLALGEGRSVFTTSEITDHLARGKEVLNMVLQSRGGVQIQGEIGSSGTVMVQGVGREISQDWKQRLQRYANQYGFGNTDLFLTWVDDWARLIGTNRLDVFKRLEANDGKHSFPRAMFIPEELQVYLLPVVKECMKTGMLPIFIERAAGPYASLYDTIAATIEGEMNVSLPRAGRIKLSRLEHSGVDKDTFMEQSYLKTPTTIFSPTVNYLLTDKEREDCLTEEQTVGLGRLYKQMDKASRDDLDSYLQDVWKKTGGFRSLLTSQTPRRAWVQYLADWGIDCHYYNYIHLQKKIQSWSGGADHGTLLSLWAKVFEERDTVTVDEFVENLASVLSAESFNDLGQLVTDRTLGLDEHLRKMADQHSCLYRHQDKVLFKIFRVLLAYQAGVKGMRNQLAHKARPFLNIILADTTFSQTSRKGVIFIDETANGGETALYAEIIGKAFDSNFRYKFFIFGQTHPELSKLYFNLGIVDGVLAHHGIHALEDFPEFMDTFYTLNESIPIFHALDYQTMLANISAEIQARCIQDLNEKKTRRNERIEELLSDTRLREIVETITQLTSYRRSSPVDLSFHLVNYYLREKRGEIGPIDRYVMPNAYLSGIADLSNRDYPTIDRQWQLLTAFNGRLRELEDRKAEQMRQIDEADREARLLDYRDYLQHWIGWQRDIERRTHMAQQELSRNFSLVKNYLLGKSVDHTKVTETLIKNYGCHYSESLK